MNLSDRLALARANEEAATIERLDNNGHGSACMAYTTLDTRDCDCEPDDVANVIAWHTDLDRVIDPAITTTRLPEWRVPAQRTESGYLDAWCAIGVGLGLFIVWAFYYSVGVLS